MSSAWELHSRTLLLRQFLVGGLCVARESWWRGARLRGFSERLLNFVERFVLFDQRRDLRALFFRVLQIRLDLRLRLRIGVTEHVSVRIELDERRDEPDPALRFPI